MRKNWLITNLNKKYLLKAGNKTFCCHIGSGVLKKAAKTFFVLIVAAKDNVPPVKALPMHNISGFGGSP